MTENGERRISRRGMIKGTAAAAAAAALAACQPAVKEVIVEKEVEKQVTVIVEKEVEKQGEIVVNYMTQLWNWQKLNMATATDQYNINNRGKVRMEVDPSPQGWQTKVVQMVKDDELLWDGMLRTRNVGDVQDLIRLGIVQPWDAFIDASSVPWAGSYWDEVLPNVRDAFTFDGHLYGLPWDGEAFVRVYRKPEWDALGETPAETLLDFERQLLELKKIFPDKAPMGFDHRPQQPHHHMLMQLWTDDPYEHLEAGTLIDVRSDAYRQMMLLIKGWYDKGILTPDTYLDNNWVDTWNKGNCCTVQTGAAWAQAQAKKIWGANAIVPTTNFVIEAGQQPKTLTFNNAAVLFKGAKHPQEVADWLLWMIDPTVEKIANYSFQKGYLNYYHIPAYKSVFEKIVPMNPDWSWMDEAMYKMVRESAPLPSDAQIGIYGSILMPWEEKFVNDQVSLDELIQNTYEEMHEQVELKMAGQK